MAMALLLASDRLHAAPELTRIADLSFDRSQTEPSGISAVGATAYMIRAGRGLIRTDGTAGGTAVVSGIAPKIMPGTITKMVGFANKIFWLGADFAIWVSDGTGPGTRWFWHGESVSPSPPFVLGSSLYFFADGNLYRSNGTVAGTQVVTDLVAIGEAFVVGNLAYMTCLSAQGNPALCATDGSAAGTRVVATLPTRATFGYRTYGVIGSRVLVFDTDGLWSVDTASGAVTELLSPVDEGLLPRPPAPVTLGAFSYFPCITAAGTELCRTDGTLAGTSVLDLYAGTFGSVPYVARLGDRLIIAASRGVAGRELYSSDGTVAGTTLLVELAPGALDGAAMSELISVGGLVYFAANAELLTPRLARTDGTAAGTTILHAQGVLTSVSTPADVLLSDSAVLQGKLVFPCFSINGSEPWISDGTPGGTKALAAISTPAPSPTKVRALELGDRVCLRTGGELISFGNAEGVQASLALHGVEAVTPTAVYFTDFDELHRTDCNGKNERLAEGLSAVFVAAAALGDRVVLLDSARRLWFSDSTTAGTAVSNLTNVSFLARAGDTIWILLDRTLLKSDGTYAGTTAFAMIDNATVTVRGFTTFGRFVAFAMQYNNETWLWRTDGTSMVRLRRMATAADRDAPVAMYAWNDVLYFGSEGALWRTDGSAGGTTFVKAIEPTGSMVAWGSHLFVAAASANGAELWRTDGTNTGTVEVADVLPGPQPSAPHDLFVQRPNGPLLFTAQTPELGRELWSLTEPTGKPSLFVDLVVGPESSGMVPLFVRGDALHFYASIDGRGTLWRTGGATMRKPQPFDREPAPQGCGCDANEPWPSGGGPALLVVLGAALWWRPRGLAARRARLDSRV